MARGHPAPLLRPPHTPMATHDDRFALEAELLSELLELRQTVAHSLGRDQYLFEMLDRAIESGHAPCWEKARREFASLPDDLLRHIRAK